jgi:WD40 repeat protein
MLLLEGHTAPVLSVAYAPDSMTLATGDSAHSLRLWDIASGRSIVTLANVGEPVLSLAFSPDGRTLAFGTSRMVYLWDVARRAVNQSIRGTFFGSYTMAFLPEWSRLAVCGYLDRRIALWDLASGNPAGHLEGQEWGILALAHAPGTRWLLSGGGVNMNGELILWDVEERRMSCRLRTLTTVRMSATFWDVTTGSYGAVSTREVGHAEAIYAVAMSPDRTLAASGSKDRLVRLWHLDGERCLADLQEHDRPVVAVSFLPDGSRLLSADESGKICVWDVATHRLRQCWDWQIGGLRSVVFAPNGMTAAAGGSRDVIVWDVEE